VELRIGRARLKNDRFVRVINPFPSSGDFEEFNLFPKKPAILGIYNNIYFNAVLHVWILFHEGPVLIPLYLSFLRDSDGRDPIISCGTCQERAPLSGIFRRKNSCLIYM